MIGRGTLIQHRVIAGTAASASPDTARLTWVGPPEGYRQPAIDAFDEPVKLRNQLIRRPRLLNEPRHISGGEPLPEVLAAATDKEDARTEGFYPSDECPSVVTRHAMVEDDDRNA
jgi:hypothetical protein